MTSQKGSKYVESLSRKNNQRSQNKAYIYVDTTRNPECWKEPASKKIVQKLDTLRVKHAFLKSNYTHVSNFFYYN